VETVALSGPGAFEKAAPLGFPRIDEVRGGAGAVEENPEIDPSRFQDDPRIAEKEDHQNEEENPQGPPELHPAETPGREKQEREEEKKLGGGEGHSSDGGSL